MRPRARRALLAFFLIAYNRHICQTFSVAFKMRILLDRYILGEWLKIFTIAMIVMLGILLMNDMYSTLGNLFESGIPTQKILLYYLLLSPTLLPIFLPISLLISFMFVLGALHRNNEITSMRAAGMNDMRITRSLWLASFVIAGLFLWANASLIPYCKESSRKLYDTAMLEKQLKQSAPETVGVVNTLCFNNRRDRRLWFMNSFSTTTNEGRGVRVSILDDRARELVRIMARSGVYDDLDKCWFFTDGQEIVFDPDKNKPVRAVGFDKRYYRNFNERPQIMILSMNKVGDLSLSENATILDAIGTSGEYAEALPYLVRKYAIWVSPLICIIVLAIAIPFSMAGVRTNPMVGVSKTIAMFFAYFVLENIMTGLGSKGVLPPFWAAAVPPLLIFAFTIFLYRKAF